MIPEWSLVDNGLYESRMTCINLEEALCKISSSLVNWKRKISYKSPGHKPNSLGGTLKCGCLTVLVVLATELGRVVVKPWGGVGGILPMFMMLIAAVLSLAIYSTT